MIAKYARAYELKTCTDMTWAEIGRALGIRPNTLKAKISELIRKGYKNAA